jgi:hypothetical protein
MLGGDQREEIIQTPTQQCFRVNVSPFKDPSGGVVIILEDITEKTKMEEQLLQASKLASIGRLTAGISHEIGNPLASISSLVQELTALECATEGRSSRDSLQAITSHLERISRIVRSLGISPASPPRARCRATRADLQRTMELVKYDKRCRVRLHTALGEIPLLVNPDQMEQVFQPAAQRARRDAGRGDAGRDAGQGRGVVVAVEDTGQHRAGGSDRVFDLLRQAARQGHGPGPEHLLRHRAEHGTRSRSRAQGGRGRRSRSACRSGNQAMAERFLIVGTKPPCAVAAARPRPRGLRRQGVGSAEEALRARSRGACDLILTDIIFGIDGIELRARARSARADRDRDDRLRHAGHRRAGAARRGLRPSSSRSSTRRSAVVRNALQARALKVENVLLRSRSRSASASSQIVGRSPGMSAASPRCARSPTRAATC